VCLCVCVHVCVCVYVGVSDMIACHNLHVTSPYTNTVNTRIRKSVIDTNVLYKVTSITVMTNIPV